MKTDYSLDEISKESLDSFINVYRKSNDFYDSYKFDDDQHNQLYYGSYQWKRMDYSELFDDNGTWGGVKTIVSPHGTPFSLSVDIPPQIAEALKSVMDVFRKAVAHFSTEVLLKGAPEVLLPVVNGTEKVRFNCFNIPTTTDTPVLEAKFFKLLNDKQLLHEIVELDGALMINGAMRRDIVTKQVKSLTIQRLYVLQPSGAEVTIYAL